MLGQAQQVRHLLRVIADGADGGTAEPRRFSGDDERRKRDAGVERCIEEDIQMIVGERLTTPGMQLALPAVVGAEDQERRGAGDPGLGEASVASRWSIACRICRSSTMMMSRCCRSLLLGEDRARAQRVSISSGATLRSVKARQQPRVARSCQVCGHGCGPSGSPRGATGAPNRCSSAAPMRALASSMLRAR